MKGRDLLMGKQFGSGVTVKPRLSLEDLSRLSGELHKKYEKNKITYTSASFSEINVQVGENIDHDKLFNDVKEALKQLKFIVVERKEKNKRYLLIK